VEHIRKSMFKKTGDPTPITRIYVEGEEVLDNENTKSVMEDMLKSVEKTEEELSNQPKTGKK
jgi:hypothetical protein